MFAPTACGERGPALTECTASRGRRIECSAASRTELGTGVELAPGVLAPDWIRVRAQLINHMSKGYEYSVILDPDAFKEEYVAEFEAEDPDTPAAPGQRRLRAFGMPDFSLIVPPATDGDALVFIL